MLSARYITSGGTNEYLVFLTDNAKYVKDASITYFHVKVSFALWNREVIGAIFGDREYPIP